LNTLNTKIWQQVANAITIVVTQAIILIAFADFFALKYLHAKRKYLGDYLFGLILSSSDLISLNSLSILST